MVSSKKQNFAKNLLQLDKLTKFTNLFFEWFAQNFVFVNSIILFLIFFPSKISTTL